MGMFPSSQESHGQKQLDGNRLEAVWHRSLSDGRFWEMHFGDFEGTVIRERKTGPRRLKKRTGGSPARRGSRICDKTFISSGLVRRQAQARASQT